MLGGALRLEGRLQQRRVVRVGEQRLKARLGHGTRPQERLIGGVTPRARGLGGAAGLDRAVARQLAP